jgi:hypothetical protein
MPAPTIDFSVLTDFALGNLSPEASAKVIRILERDPEASRQLEVILNLIADYEKRQKQPPRLADPND